MVGRCRLDELSRSALCRSQYVPHAESVLEHGIRRWNIHARNSPAWAQPGDVVPPPLADRGPADVGIPYRQAVREIASQQDGPVLLTPRRNPLALRNRYVRIRDALSSHMA